MNFRKPLRILYNEFVNEYLPHLLKSEFYILLLIYFWNWIATLFKIYLNLSKVFCYFNTKKSIFWN